MARTSLLVVRSKRVPTRVPAKDTCGRFVRLAADITRAQYINAVPPQFVWTRSRRGGPLLEAPRSPLTVMQTEDSSANWVTRVKNLPHATWRRLVHSAFICVH